MVMPLIFSGFLSLGVGEWWGWRLAMIVPGIALFLTGIAYSLLTQDTPGGNLERVESSATGAFGEAIRDPRVWALFVLYGACFGLELTIDNIAALYFVDYFHLDLKIAGFLAGTFGMMNLFARALGGIVSDRCSRRWGLTGRSYLLGATIALEGVALICFSRASSLGVAIACMLLTGLFVKMSNGATYAVVPFVNKRALGAVAGIVGAGGNVGAVLAGFLFKSESITWPQALLILGGLVTLSATLALTLRFSESRAVQQSEVPELAGAAMGD
jgi:NNP family nitrate/nitrite transporter-like MFS transporter